MLVGMGKDIRSRAVSVLPKDGESAMAAWPPKPLGGTIGGWWEVCRSSTGLKPDSLPLVAPTEKWKRHPLVSALAAPPPLRGLSIDKSHKYPVRARP